jgi:hypothetical protein
MELKKVNDDLQNKKYSDVEYFFKNNDYNNIENKYKNGYLSIKIRYLIEINDIKSVSNIIYSNYKLMKRDYLLYCIKINNVESLYVFNNYVKKNNFLQTKDIDILIQNQCHDLLKSLDGYYYNTSYQNNINDFNVLKKYTLDDDIKQKILSYYNDKIKLSKLEMLLENIKDIDCIIDGGNLSHYNKGKLDYKYVESIYKIICKKYKNPLFIIHKKHKKKLKNFILNINHFITPFNEYDDYYLIIACIITNKPIITNDKFKDHIFEMFKLFENNNKIENFIKESIINYTHYNLNKHNEYSNCIQYIDNSIYIPAKKGFYKFIL